MNLVWGDLRLEKVLSDEVVEEILSLRLPLTDKFQKCSYILPDGKFLKMEDHYEAHKFLVSQDYVSCPPDAEQLLSDLGYIRYSYIGYMTLANKKPTREQYKSLEVVLMNIAKFRDEISVQIQSQPKFYMNFNLNDIPHIIDRVKWYYQGGTLLP